MSHCWRKSLKREIITFIHTIATLFHMLIRVKILQTQELWEVIRSQNKDQIFHKMMSLRTHYSLRLSNSSNRHRTQIKQRCSNTKRKWSTKYVSLKSLKALWKLKRLRAFNQTWLYRSLMISCSRWKLWGWHRRSQILRRSLMVISWGCRSCSCFLWRFRKSSNRNLWLWRVWLLTESNNLCQQHQTHYNLG